MRAVVNCDISSTTSGSLRIAASARRMAADKRRRQQEAEQLIHDDPLVRDMLAQFKTARIVPGSIKPL